MKLPDFEQFEPMNRLRREMGAEALGAFEPFDPKTQLTSLELEQLTNQSLVVASNTIRSLSDQTLAYKDARVLVFGLSSQSSPVGSVPVHTYHFALCRQLASSGQYPLSQKTSVHVSFEITPSIRQVLEVDEPGLELDIKPCWDCLHALRLEGFDGEKHRKRLHSEQVWQTFDTKQFKKKYPFYPL